MKIGTRLGPYEIVAPLGAGGMGEVYRAQDTKLGRDVAIKVLPEEFTKHSQKLARFEREARLLAALNHPKIATLHGLERAEDQPFLVMELIEGETLAERISGGPIPLRETLQMATQIAEALEAAHEKGVIHRDLKPANIKVDAEGNVKVLDFGLAKAFGDDAPESDLSHSPTLSRDATGAGVILGTAVYMSPEQARGKAVDKRTDIFSFGAVLYEMLTGKKAFPGEDVSDVLAAVIRSEPNWQALPTGVPPSVTKLLRRCLVKERKNRLQSVGDVRVELQEILTEPAESTSEAAIAVSTPSRMRERLVWAFVGAIVAGIIVWGTTRPGPAPVTRLAVTLPTTDQLLLSGGIALSPDGRDLVYVATRAEVLQLHRRSMDELEPVPIRGTEGARLPFFSPNGEWVGFFSEGKLKKVTLDGGPAVALCNAVGGFGASWGPDDVIVFGEPLGLMRVSASGGTLEPVTTLERGEVRHQNPVILPSGRAVLFSVYSGTTGTARIAVQSLETGERTLLEGGTYLHYASTGHIVFARADSLWAVPFDPDGLEVTGNAAPVLEGVPMVNPAGLVNFALADDGSLAYVPGLSLGTNWFVWVDREGNEERVASELKNHQEFTLSPDGVRIAVRVSDGGDDDLWTYDLERGTSTRLTFDPAGERFPLWTPDGQRVVFGGAEGMFWKAADGTGDVEPLTEHPSHQRPEAFSPDGHVLVFQDLGSGRDLGMVTLEGERTPTPLLNADFQEMNAALSPDGHWLAYQSNETGENNIYVRPFPDVNAGKWQVSSEGGSWPLWAPHGQELFYFARQDSNMMAVSVQTEPTFALGRREPLFSMEPYFTSATARRVAIHPDGRRFLLLKTLADSETAASPHIVIVQNWFEELKRLVPTE